MSGSGDPELVVGEQDGLPTFSSPSPDRLPVAGLVFRVGAVDESFARSGWTHLVEHLCLQDLRTPTLEVSGSVGLRHTWFGARGPRPEVESFLTEVSSRLAEPDWGDAAIGRAVSILRAESEAMPGTWSPDAAHLRHRFGLHGPGLAGVQVGLDLLGPGEIERWAASCFGRGDAALFTSFTPTAGLRLPLPVAPHRPPIPVPAELFTTPRHLMGTSASVSLSGRLTGVPGLTADLLGRVLREELHQLLREQMAAGYGCRATSLQLAPSDQLVVLDADSTADGDAVTDAVVGRLERLGQEGVPDLTVRHAVEGVRRRLTEDLDPWWAARASAEASLDGMPAVTGQAVLGELALAVEELPSALALYLESLLVVSGSPGDLVPERGLPPVAHAQAQVLGRLDPDDPRGIAFDGAVLQEHWGDERIRVARVDRAVGLLSRPDGQRVLVDAAGGWVTVEPQLHHRGQQLVSELDSCVSPSVVVWLPTRPRGEIPQPLTGWARHLAWGRRWWRAVRSVARYLMAIPLMLLWVAVLVAADEGELGWGWAASVIVVTLAAMVIWTSRGSVWWPEMWRPVRPDPRGEQDGEQDGEHDGEDGGGDRQPGSS